MMDKEELREMLRIELTLKGSSEIDLEKKKKVMGMLTYFLRLLFVHL